MHSRTLHHWTLVAVCAATAALVGPGCNRDKPTMPRAGSRYQGVANTQQPAPPGTGGSGASTSTDAKWSAAAGAHQLQQNQIGAPGFTTPQEPVPGDRGGADRFQGPMGQGSELGSRHATH
ncbi:hypothetical protein HJC10_08060 [Corallococcus exiguus]|uniref:hypothetical protein n=1 Tax=Corallococcus TaxID=83461 RepID=UPI000EF6E1CD|nr:MULTISPECIES: hypothetical protein [Corallococcus]NNB97103.1 hypothetical protein [Corallococcus exiguus]NNC02806.1 hypothetical protein [Corallococcus exiguus]NPC47535.1 hypothetical protein [Corallococcus exiguus]